VPFLINMLDSPSKDVRGTSCWTLSKFSEWIGNDQEAGDQRILIFQSYH
jgi:hypothetical protein